VGGSAGDSLRRRPGWLLSAEGVIGDERTAVVLATLALGDGREAVILSEAVDGRRVRIRNVDSARKDRAADRLWSWGLSTGPWTTVLPDGILISGDLVAGSERVEIRAPVDPQQIVLAGGAYMALLPDRVAPGEVFVVFRDRAGRIVPWPSPELLKREPVVDTDVRCPACGELAWDAIEVRSEPQDSHYRQRGLMCRVCGRQHGGWRAVGRRRPGAAERSEPRREAVLNELGEPPGLAVVRAAGFAVYALDGEIGHGGKLSSVARENETITSVSISHRVRSAGSAREVKVMSWPAGRDHEREPISIAISGLSGLLFNEAEQSPEMWELSADARDLRRERNVRLVGERAQRATRTTVQVCVDGTDVTFAIASDDQGAWSAASVIDDVQVRIVGRDLEPSALRLQTITDPEAFFSS
jgi:hypothetical protein